MNADKIEEILAFHRDQKEKMEARLADFRRIRAAGSHCDLIACPSFSILPPSLGLEPAGSPSCGS